LDEAVGMQAPQGRRYQLGVGGFAQRLAEAPVDLRGQMTGAEDLALRNVLQATFLDPVRRFVAGLWRRSPLRLPK